MKSYEELIKLNSYAERLEYLMLLDNNVKSPRGISNRFYKSHMWMVLRDEILKRDNGCDLGLLTDNKSEKLIVHHINPIDENDIINGSKKLIDPNNLITVSVETHNIIHYGNKKETMLVERTEGDTLLW